MSPGTGAQPIVETQPTTNHPNSVLCMTLPGTTYRARVYRCDYVRSAPPVCPARQQSVARERLLLFRKTHAEAVAVVRVPQGAVPDSRLVLRLEQVALIPAAAAKDDSAPGDRRTDSQTLPARSSTPNGLRRPRMAADLVGPEAERLAAVGHVDVCVVGVEAIARG